MSSPATPWGVSDQYIVLDSFEKVENSNISNGELVFNFGFQRPTASNTIGINGTLNNVIEFQIGAFYIPSVPLLPFITNDNQDTNFTPLEVPNKQLPRLTINTGTPEVYNAIGSNQSMACYGGRLAVEFKGENAQGIIGLNGSKFHFEMQANLSFTLTNVIVTPLPHGWDKFSFTQPIRDISRMTVVIKNPDDGIFLPPDVLYGVVPFIDQNGIGQPVLAFRVSRQNHDILVNDRIIIRSVNFSGGENDPIFKLVDEWVNNIDGHLVGQQGTSVIDPNYLMKSEVVETTIRMNPDVNLYDIVQSNPTRYYVGKVLSSSTRINICIAKNRIRIPLKLRKIVLGQQTNFKSA